jgi:hypothetical protein
MPNLGQDRNRNSGAPPWTCRYTPQARAKGSITIRIFLREHPDILVKDGAWRDPHSQRADSSLDFFVVVLGMSFARAMRAHSGHA